MTAKTASKSSTSKKSSTKSTKSSNAKSTKSTKTAKATKTTTKNNKSNSSSSSFFLKRLKSTSWLAILEALVVGAFGILLIINADWVVTTIFYVVGIFLIVKGVYKVVNYFAVHGKNDFYNNDLLYGIIALVFGVLIVILQKQISSVISIVIGAWLVYGALVRMNTAIKLHTAGVKQWFYVLLISLVMLALGVYLIVSFKALESVMWVVGIVMVVSAILSIVDDVVFIRHLDELEQ